MPKFITIGYGDQAGYERTPKDVRDAAHAHDAELKKGGALMGVAGAPVQVRNPLAAGVKTENSAFMSSALPVAGFALIEAADLAEASGSFRKRHARSPMASWKSGPWRRPARSAESARRLRFDPHIFYAFTTRMGLPAKKASAFSTLCG
jgi:hypothetical protein